MKKIYGTNSDDNLLGTSANEKIFGYFGDDVLSGLGGDDFIRGGPGNDRIDGGSGNDRIFGASGKDVLIGGEGDDYIRGLSGSNILDGGNGNDILSTFIYTASPSKWVNRMIGGNGNDTYYSSGKDIIVEEIGGGIDSLIIASFIEDTFSFPDNIESVKFLGTNARIDEFTIYGNNSDNSVTMDYLYNSNTYVRPIVFFGKGGDDGISGTFLDDRLFGGRGKDSVFGRDGDDLLKGGRGADWFLGEGGNDTIFGGAGADKIDGGKGRDTLVGGRGADTFVFYAGSGFDRITDFNASKDSFEIRQPKGGLTFDDFSIGTQGADVRVDFLNVSIILENTLLSDVTEDLFVFI